MSLVNKSLFLRYLVHDPDLLPKFYESFRIAYPLVGDQLAVLPGDEYEENAKLVIYQILHNGDDEQWEAGLKLCFDAAMPNTTMMVELGFEIEQVEFIGVEIMGDGVTPEERHLINWVGGLTEDLKSVIMPAFQEIYKLSMKIDSLESELRSTKAQSVNNAQTIVKLIQAFRNIVEELDLDEDDMFPTSFETIQ